MQGLLQSGAGQRFDSLVNHFQNPGTGLYVFERSGEWFVLEKTFSPGSFPPSEGYELRHLGRAIPGPVERTDPSDVLGETGWRTATIDRVAAALLRALETK